jgi:transcriptional regulator with XRE-family HTH domain
MVERIKELMQQKGLNPSAFADKIQVQRSSISHILNGRNKPSLELIQKIIAAFPDIDIEWLITGTKSKIETTEVKKRESNENQTKTYSTEICLNDKSNEIEKIVFFYRNGTFKIYQSN